ncbi:MAG TPA: heat-inducible transcriptional repressor HrcA [Firmicutes bacterium]|nr:heat-inducible transcriptional repressor HrcA [Bacillota bacterium]
MTLSDRKKKILYSLVDDYIVTAEPVSSKKIQEEHLPDYSSATIRNELSALESMGYLVQPHTSAGRVPSQKAFRFYVDQLMVTPLTQDEISAIEGHFTDKVSSMQEVMQKVAEVIAEVTHYTSVAVEDAVDKEIVQKIKLVKLSQGNALVLVVSDRNVFKDHIIDIPSNLTEEDLEKVNGWLNKLFTPKKLEELKSLDLNEILDDELSALRGLFAEVLDILKEVSNKKQEIITQGASQILDYPEYSDKDNAKQFLQTIEQKQKLAKMFTSQGDGMELSIKIGREEDVNLPDGCSLVTAKIGLNNSSYGNIGVIGPVRMDYKKVVSVLDHMGRLIEKLLSEEE